VEVISRRFILRDFELADRASFHAFHYNPRLLSRYSPATAAPDLADNLFDRFHLWACERPRVKYQLAVLHRDLPTDIVGCCGLRGEAEHRNAEMGLSLAPELWGRFGYALEIAGVLLELAFNHLDFDEVNGTTAHRNKQVTRLAEWFGGVQIGFTSATGSEFDQVHWKVTPEAWRSTEGLRRRWTRNVRIIAANEQKGH
jgi:ribosomal-protein-alanine N-acetyltransferase